MDACVLFPFVSHPGGYGRLRVDGKMRYAHRVAWEAQRGPIPEGLVIDHLCRARSCVNVEHMEVVTNGENVRRGWRWREKPPCPHGSPRVGECNRCHADRQRAYRARKRGERDG